VYNEQTCAANPLKACPSSPRAGDAKVVRTMPITTPLGSPADESGSRHCSETAPRNRRNIILISLSQLGMGFCFNFVMVFLPFFVHDAGGQSTEQTLVWIGLIMGAPSFVAALVSTFWGSLASRFSPKMLFMRGLLSHAILILLMGFIHNLPVLLFLRIVQGVMGGISTVGLVIVSASSTRAWVSRDIGLFQNLLTVGQLLGPPVGALVASLLGYQWAFVSASALVFVTLAFCFVEVKDVSPSQTSGGGSGQRTLTRATVTGWLLCFAATVQLMFLPSILPSIFQGFGIDRDIALRWSGLVVMAYTGTAMVGTYVLCRIAPRVGRVRLLSAVLLLASLIQVALSLSQGIASFVAMRALQTALVAATLPLVLSGFGADARGGIIGFLNSGRFAGNSLGPVIATFLLAVSDLRTLYLVIGAMTVLAVLLYWKESRESRRVPSPQGAPKEGDSQ
jgi:MFS transporter, DHA1 family, multidrug resistance protein